MTAVHLFMACGLTELFTGDVLYRKLQLPEKVRKIALVYGRRISVPEKLKNETLALAEKFGPWDEVVDFTDASERLAAPERRFDRVICAAELEALGISEPDVIVTHTLSNPLERMILDVFGNARIFLYDNGIASHIAKPVSEGAVSSRLAVNQIYGGHLRRVELAFFAFGDMLPLPVHVQGIKALVPSAGELRAGLQDLSARLPNDAFGLSERELASSSSLLVGTSFYRMNLLTREQERAAYDEVIDELVAGGERMSFFKPHPRADADVAPAGKNVVQIRPSLPLELLPIRTSIDRAFSVSSTALLSLRKIFGIPTFVAGEHLGIDRALPYVDLLYRSLRSNP